MKREESKYSDKLKEHRKLLLELGDVKDKEYQLTQEIKKVEEELRSLRLKNV